MAGRVWNYLTGYVMIEVKGRGLERFVNRAAQSGVPLWRIRRIASDTIDARTSVAGFYGLRPLLRGTNLRVRILGKHGLPIALSRFRGREVLLFGWMLVLALIVAASRFIWYVSVEGCDVISEEQIVKTLAELGVEAGSPRTATETFDLGGRLAASDSRIAWAGVKLEGVILRVQIVEANPYVPEDNGDEPGSLFAKKDGVITRVEVRGGKAKVIAGDAVLAGQELITGVIRNDELGYIVARAKGTVMAQVVYCVSASAGPLMTIPVRTGAPENELRVSLLGYSLGGARPGREEVPTGKWRLTNCFLPVVFEAIQSYALTEKLAQASVQKLEEKARALAEGAVLAQIPTDAVMLSKQSETVVNEDGSVTVTVTVVTEENIAELRGLDGN
ncbi:MAG TPA: sporulation protein YqfD [Clostridia bacterium]|nr:sporulation protein YqfD [Clostridia bacterium]